MPDLLRTPRSRKISSRSLRYVYGVTYRLGPLRIPCFRGLVVPLDRLEIRRFIRLLRIMTPRYFSRRLTLPRLAPHLQRRASGSIYLYVTVVELCVSTHLAARRKRGVEMDGQRTSPSCQKRRYDNPRGDQTRKRDVHGRTRLSSLGEIIRPGKKGGRGRGRKRRNHSYGESVFPRARRQTVRRLMEPAKKPKRKKFNQHAKN